MGTDHLTPTRARELLERHGLRAKKGYGQHFLVDPNTVRKIVRLAELSPDDIVLEIGPGLGSLTLGLAPVVARVIALEVDPRVTDVLREVIADTASVEVVEGDALEVDLPSMCPEGTKLVANLPYNVATPVILRVLTDVPEVVGGLVMVQREMGERWVAGPGSKAYGAVSLKVAYHASARIVADVPPTVFQPPPKVRSVLVGWERHPEAPVDVDDPRGFLRMVTAAFGHRRKTLRNALSAAGYDPDAVERAGIAPQARPEELNLEAFARLWRELGA